jgi:hypothetical protein
MSRLLRVAFSQELGQRLKVSSGRLRQPPLQVPLLWLLLLALLLALPRQLVLLRQLNLRQLLL